MKNSRRSFIKNSMLAATLLSTSVKALSDFRERDPLIDSSFFDTDSKNEDAFKISMFSKQLHWLNYDELANAAFKLGFDGLDLTVRAKGHVLPDNVERDLPLAVAAAKRAGIKVYFISTDINDAEDPLTERIIKTAASLNIKHYRMKWYYYDEKISIVSNIKIFEKKMIKLAKLNKKYKIFGEYQNHSLQYEPGVYFGPYFSSTIWDLYLVLKKINSPWLGSQYDICHATIESTRSWGIGLDLLTPYIKSIHVKDYVWKKNGKVWDLKGVPIGEGMVDYKKFFEIVKKSKINVPITFYYNYPIGAAIKGFNEAIMRKDLESFRELIHESIKNDKQ
jgi:L-ribulose-5-phosphate 3-epimerase